MDADRNPSPPPEFLDVEESLSGDRISGTVFSRQWVFQCLLNAIKVAENESTMTTNTEGEAVDAVELDKEVEDELCTLWDMSANSDVAHFLQEFKASEIFLQVISTSKSPRMVEILVGILANMAVFPDLSLALSQQSDLLRTALYLLGSTDTPTLIQVVRLCHACLSNQEALKMWLDAIKGSSSCLSDVQFMLSNCLNGEVLKTCIQALDCLLDQDSELCAHCSNADFVDAICVAASQLSGSDRLDSLGAFWHILHSLDYENKIGHLLLGHREQLHDILRECLCECCDTEHTLPSTQRCQSLAVTLAVICSLEDAALAANQPSRFG
ncbi:protein saal1-like [Ornithodoros turicata]|uniref:protein saal1-like n=1 Tax=Ornithodoros turicata TaxID=34597 RepID=UPI003138D260